MGTAMKAVPRWDTLADLLKEFGGIAPQRVRLHPPPGTATVRDVIAIHDRTGRLCELVDGVLVEKTMGWLESCLTVWLVGLLDSFVEKHDLGLVTGPDGAVRLASGLVRIPDISFFSWEQFPMREIPPDPIPNLVPYLAVEVLSKGNTPKEMARKLRDFFLAGVRLVWYVDPKTRTVQVYTSPNDFVTLMEGQTLHGGDVLPGLALPLRKVFGRVAKAPRRPAKRKVQGDQTRGNNNF